MTRVPIRSSLRSRDSNSTLTDTDLRERIKDCCRKLIAFMCTQVGVGGLVIGYAIIGAFGFMMIEAQSQIMPSTICVRELIRKQCAEELWYNTASNRNINVFDKTSFHVVSNRILQRYQDNFTANYKKETCNGLKPTDVWSFPAAMMFCLSVFTMIGYGTLVPQTAWGKAVTVLYAVLGIPLYVLYFLNMGKVLAQTFRSLYTWLHECTGKRKPGQRITVPSTACLWVIFGYVLGGSIMFAEWEGWDYLDSAYFCVTSLCKIGMGDLVPGWTHNELNAESQTKLIINFIYLLLGMGLIAMCYDLMKEDVYVKVREMKNHFLEVIDAVHYQIETCCRSELVN